jgi:hypothetical protein
MRAYLGLLLLTLLPLTGCASMRGASVGTDTATYRVSVTNQTGRTMTVSWSEAGGTSRPLGEVAAGRTESFVIAGATGTTVSITARASGGQTSGPYTVSLISGEVQRVTLR